MNDPASFWASPTEDDELEGVTVSPPVTDEAVRGWEESHSVRLPSSLAAALKAQDGGLVRGADMVIESLGGFSPLSDEQWDDHMDPDNQEDIRVEDRSRLIMIGDAYGCGIVLDYSVGPEPRILRMDHNMGGVLVDDESPTFDKFVASIRRP